MANSFGISSRNWGLLFGLSASFALAFTGLFPVARTVEATTTGAVNLVQLTLPCYLLGDTNHDRVVDQVDLDNVRNNFGGSGLGDTNWDGDIDIDDLNNVRNNFGTSCPKTTPKPTPTPTPSSTPTPSPDPTSTVTPTPTPTAPENGGDGGDGGSGGGLIASLSVEKTDHRETTRPGHSVVYTIVVKNTGDRKITDIVATDIVPAGVIIKGASSEGSVSERKVSWGEFTLAEGEKVAFSITALVDTSLSNGHVLVNTVKVRSENEGISVSDTDTTVVERLGRIEATQTTDSGQPIPVPVTARTGAGSFGLLSTLLGGSGLTFVLRRHLI